mgnify:FL=1
MKKRIYIQVTEEVGKDPRLNAVKALDGFWWCDQNCMETAPELFTGDEETKIMDANDFPKNEINGII